MKRGEPPQRKTPLKAGKPPARKTAMTSKPAPNKARSTLPKPTKPIAAKSAKRVVQDGQRAKMMKVKRDGEDVVCERCLVRWASDGHEVLSRARGGDPTDPDEVHFLCRLCHDWVTQHPTLATAEGWLTSAGPRPRIIRTNTGSSNHDDT